MQDLIVIMLDTLKKDKNLSVHKVERDLGFSNGLLGKAAKGDSNLSDDKLSKLGKYYFDKINEGKPLGYLKQLEDGSIEVGVIEPEKEKELPPPPIDANAPETAAQRITRLMAEQKAKLSNNKK